MTEQGVRELPAEQGVRDLPAELVSLAVECPGHVATVTMLGPGKGNAMGPDFWRELPQVFAALDADPQVRSVVLTGSGEHFSYGLDLPAMMPRWGELLAEGAQAEPRTRFLNDVRRLQDAVSSV
ncbi:MAG: enoyl-CoA hydratase-related protein, partial [Sciscionella sp.]